jgi:tetrahydromethanopterin S-methyltransferase subunit E
MKNGMSSIAMVVWVAFFKQPDALPGQKKNYFCARFSVYSTNICVTSIFFQIWWNTYLFCVMYVVEPLAVTNILK